MELSSDDDETEPVAKKIKRDQECHVNNNNNTDFQVQDKTRIKIISLISIYLHVHPLGCSLQDIFAYVKDVMKDSFLAENMEITENNVAKILVDNAFIFSSEDSTTINGTSIANSKWKFCGFT